MGVIKPGRLHKDIHALCKIAISLSGLRVSPTTLMSTRHMALKPTKRAVVYAAVKMTKSSLGAGKLMGRDHTTILNSLKKMNEEEIELGKLVWRHWAEGKRELEDGYVVRTCVVEKEVVREVVQEVAMPVVRDADKSLIDECVASAVVRLIDPPFRQCRRVVHYRMLGEPAEVVLEAIPDHHTGGWKWAQANKPGR